MVLGSEERIAFRRAGYEFITFVHIPADTGTVFPVILGHRWQS
jgi:hypothetical protein